MTHLGNAEPPVSKIAVLSILFPVGALGLNLLFNSFFTEPSGGPVILAYLQIVMVPLVLIAGIATSIVGIVRTRGGRAQGLATAIIALVLSSLGLILFVLLTMVYAALMMGTAY